MRTTLLSTSRPFVPDHYRRIRLSLSVSLFAGSLGAAFILVSVLSRTDPDLVPGHLPILSSTLVSLAGIIAGVAMTWPTVYYIGERASVPRALLLWLAFGLVFGFALPFTSGILLPLSGVFIDFSRGLLGLGDLFNEVMNSLFRAPINAFVNGTLSTFTGVIVGLSWGLGGWAIDRLNSSADSNTSRFGSWALAVGLAVVVLLAMVLIPAETLARIK